MKLSKLLALALVLLISVGTLAGSTIAWFTDTVTSAKNMIQSGTLDIELEYSKDFTNWASVKDQSDLFTKQLWEPGHTDVVYLRLTNKGSLALKYLLGMNYTETAGTNVAGESFNLSEYLKCGIADDVTAAYADRSSARNAVEDKAETLATCKFSGEMEPQADAKTVALVVYMPEEVGNEANAMIDCAPQIDLGIGVEAYQLEYERDSFGNDYDADGDLEVDDTTTPGIIYITDQMTGKRYLQEVNENYTGDTVTVLDGVVGLANGAFSGNNTVKTVYIPASVTDFGGNVYTGGTGASGGAFNGSSVENIILSEGMKEIPAAAFNKAANLKSVDIPSTVESIGIDAFKGAGLTKMAIPATVKTISHGAFRDMPNLTTVTIEGDSVHLPTYAFRTCPNLESVFLKVNSLTLGDGMIFTKAEHNNDDPNGIVIYVYNGEVQKVLEEHSDVKCTIVLVDPVDTTAEFKAAIAEGGMIAIDGEIAVDSIGADAGVAKGATISDGTLTRDTANGNALMVSTTEKVTFEDVTFESVKGSAVLATRTDGANIEVNDCVFNNQAAPSTGNTGVQVYAENVTMTFNRCTFNNMPVITNSSYKEGIKLIFNNCTFNWKGDNCPGFIQIANNLKITVDINNCKFAYTTESQYNTAKTMISYNWPETSTININGLEVVGTRNNDKIWKICSNNSKVDIKTSGNLSYTFNGEAIDFATYLK